MPEGAVGTSLEGGAEQTVLEEEVTVVTIDATDQEFGQGSASYARAVGERLRSVRRQRRLSLHAVEQASGGEFKASVLGAYERGERSIAVLRLRRLADLYAVPVDAFLPAGADGGTPVAERRDERTGDGSRRLTSVDVGKVTVDLARLARLDVPERTVVQRYISMILMQRTSPAGRTVTIRAEDIRAIGSIFRLTPREMCDRLTELGVLVES